MSKQIFKIIIINILLIFLVFLSLDYKLYKKDNNNLPFIHMVSSLNSKEFKDHYKKIINNGYYQLGNDQSSFMFRRPVKYKNNNKSIIIFGGSFAWGARLDEHQTFHYKISKLMKRTVYNRAISAWGTQHMLYQLLQKDFYNTISEPEYIIYVFISNHIDRIFKYRFINMMDKDNYNYLKYNNFKDSLIEEHRLQHIPYWRFYNEVILPFIARKSAEKHGFEFLEKHLIESKRAVDSHYKNVKFVILDYETESKCFNNYGDILNEENVKKLRNDGFIVIKTSDLTNIKLDEKYYLDKKDEHPNEKAWDLITPLLVRKLKEIEKGN